MDDLAAHTRVYRPLGARMVSGVAAVCIVGTATFLWLMLPSHVRGEFGWLDRVTMVACFAGMVGVLYGVFRTRATASVRGLTVTNGYRRHEFHWAEVVSISLTPHRPWAVVDLADGSTMAVMALQSSDGPRASRAAHEIAGLIAGRSHTDRDD